MKNIVYVAASAIALAAASPALAQANVNVNQTGTNHIVDIEQVEDVLNSIDITQAGDAQDATIYQRVPGGGNTAFGLQGDIGGAGGNQMFVVQTGSDNLAAIGQNSAANIASANQSGDMR